MDKMEKTKICKFCGKTFVKKFSVKKHLYNIHHIELLEVKVDSFLCEYCGQMYSTIQSLKRHQKTYCKFNKSENSSTKQKNFLKEKNF